MDFQALNVIVLMDCVPKYLAESMADLRRNSLIFKIWITPLKVFFKYSDKHIAKYKQLPANT